ncbi:hypothetical protein XENTR_v10018476 [Xenopus tropicalis]|nr:hypothetical protein XENTR_v10018476 [Xenopus tropicalis]|eukprot:XP_017951404.1 PREDICTED: gastric intrinsic factor [Xenopus tropicalis]
MLNQYGHHKPVNMFMILSLVAFLLCVPYTGAQKEVSNPITVEYTIVNNLVGDNFKSFIQISVNEGSTLLQVMAKAAEDNPKEFSFKTEETSFGPFVTTINHLSGSNNDKTFWQFFSGSTPLNEGVGVYKPSNKEHILAIFSKY